MTVVSLPIQIDRILQQFNSFKKDYYQFFVGSGNKLIINHNKPSNNQKRNNSNKKSSGKKKRK